MEHALSVANERLAKEVETLKAQLAMVREALRPFSRFYHAGIKNVCGITIPVPSNSKLPEPHNLDDWLGLNHFEVADQALNATAETVAKYEADLKVAVIDECLLAAENAKCCKGNKDYDYQPHCSCDEEVKDAIKALIPPGVCETCNGEGSIEREIEYPNGTLADVMVYCPDCEGWRDGSS